MSTGAVRGVMLPERGQPAAGDVVSVPAVVSYRGGKLAVGEPALMMAAVVPDAIFPGPLRLLGRKADDPLVRRYAERFSLVFRLSKGELRWVPEEEPKDPGLGAIQAMTALFEHLLEMLDRARERHAVVAVPPWLSDAGRSQLVRAAANAQITVRRFVTRPVAIALSLTAARQLLGRGMIVDAGAGGISAALVEGRSRSLTVEESAARDTSGAHDVAAEIVRSTASEDASRQTRELLRQGADALMRTLTDAPLAERSIDTPSGAVSMRLEQWELDLLMGPANHDLAEVLEATQSGRRRLPTWFSGPMAEHRALRSTASEKAQGPLRHVDDSAAALGAAQVAALVSGQRDDLNLEDGETTLAATGRAARDSERASTPPAENVVSGPGARRERDTYRPPTNMTVKEVSTKRARTSTRRLSADERARRRRERSLKVREAQKGPLPTRGKTDPTESTPDPAQPDADPGETGPSPQATRQSRVSEPPRAPSTPPGRPTSPPAPVSEPPRPEENRLPIAPPAPEPAPTAPSTPPPDDRTAEPAPGGGREDAAPSSQGRPSTASPTVPAQFRVQTEPAKARVPTEPPEADDRTANRRSVTEPGIPAAKAAATDGSTDVPVPGQLTPRGAGGRPVMSSRGAGGRRPTAPQISLARGADPEPAPSSKPKTLPPSGPEGATKTRRTQPPDPHAVTEPSMTRLSQPPRISELPPAKSSIKAPNSSPPRPSVPPGGRLSLPPGAIWPQSGGIKNPKDAAGILDMAVVRELREEDLEPVALPVLLRRIIGRADMVGVLAIRAGRIELELPVQDTCLLLARADHNALRRAFDEQEGSWNFISGDRVDVAKHPLSELKKLRTLGLEGLRRMLRHTERTDLEATFGHRYDEAPSVHPAKTKHPRRLRLDRREVRAVEQHVDGKATVRELTQTSGLGAGTTLQVLALLDMFEVLRWPEGDAL